MTPTKTTGKIAYLEALRLAATVAVVIMHLISVKFHAVEVTSHAWQTMNVYESLVRWPVAIFVMISGALFLEGKQSIKRLWSKYIPRIMAAFVFWSAVYALVSHGRNGVEGMALASEFFNGHYHMWYLYFIAGLYVITPFLRKIVESRELTRYFLGMSLIFGMVLPRVVDALGLISPEIGAIATGVMGKAKIYFLMGHVFYYVLGYALNRWEPGKRQRRMVYAAGLGSLVLTAAGSAGLSLWKNAPVELLYDPASVNIALIAAAIFLFAKNHVTRLPKWLGVLSGGCFGVYLMHPLVIEGINYHWNLNVMTFHPALSVPVLGIGVFGVCWGISWLLGKIPVAGKYIT